MTVAWAMLWGGSRSTKPRVFPCKVAAGDDERYLCLQIALEWLHECCMAYVVGRKPEHETS